jgi:hypothetical protein
MFQRMWCKFLFCTKFDKLFQLPLSLERREEGHLMLNDMDLHHIMQTTSK